MNKKKIILLITLLVIIIIFIVSLTIYKFIIYDVEKNYYIWTRIETRKKYENYEDELDKDIYKDYIIEEDKNKIEYTILDDSKSIKGNVYIGNDKCLYISDWINNLTYKISTIKFKTMYAKDIDYKSGIYIYLISNDNKLYYYFLETNNIKDGIINEIVMPYDVVGFTTLDLTRDAFETKNTLFILASDGNVYDVTGEIRYNKKVKSLYGNLYVFDDNTMTNQFWNVLEDENKNPYKIKYVFETFEDNEFTGENTKIIITDNNEMLVLNDDMEYVYKFSRKVKRVVFDVNDPYVKGNLKLTFDDNSYADLRAECNQYYCVNDFAK